jgi:hypothetical protein
VSKTHTVILVYSTSYAIKIEKILQRAGISSQLIPVPRRLSSDCGVCVRISRPDRKRSEALVQSAQIETEGFYDI